MTNKDLKTAAYQLRNEQLEVVRRWAYIYHVSQSSIIRDAVDAYDKHLQKIFKDAEVNI